MGIVERIRGLIGRRGTEVGATEAVARTPAEEELAIEAVHRDIERTRDPALLEIDQATTLD